MHRASLSAWDSCCSLWLLGLVFIFSCIGWVMHTAPRFVYLEVLDGLPIAYLQVFVCWAARYGLYSYYCGTRSIWSSISPLLFIHCVHTWLFLTLYFGESHFWICSNTPECELKAALGTKLACSVRKQFCEQTSSVSSREPPRCQHGCRQPSWRPSAVVKTALLCWSEGVLDYDCWWSCWNSMPSPRGEGCKPLTEDTVL